MLRTLKNLFQTQDCHTKSRKIRRLFKRVLGGSILNKFRQSSIRKEHACFKYLVGISAKKEKKKRKRVVLKNREMSIFRDSNHQSLYKNINFHNDSEWNPGPVYVNELPLIVITIKSPTSTTTSRGF